MIENSNKVISEGELSALYKRFPDVSKFLGSKGCPKSEREDIFQEALLIYVRKTEEGIVHAEEPFAYVLNTAKFLWYNQARKKGKSVDYSTDEDFLAQQSDDWEEKEMRLQQIEEAILKIGKKCQQILTLFYSKAMSMAEIAKKVDLRNEKVVKAQKYRCINKVKEQITLKNSSL